MKSFDLPDYQDILESIQDGFVVIDKNLRYLYANKRVGELMGISEKDLIGKKFTDVFPNHNLNIANLFKIVKHAWIEKKVATLEIYFKPVDRWYFLSVYPLKDKYTVFFRDITVEKQIREELRSSKEELDIIFKNVSDGIVIQEKTGKIIYANDAAASLSGFANVEHMLSVPESALPERYDIFDNKKKPIQWKDAPGRQVLFNGKDSAEATLCFVDKKTKEVIWLNVKSAKIASTMVQGPCAISIFHNVTILKLLEQQKDNFLSMVSHELKTPLTVLKAYEHMLQKQFKDPLDINTSNVIKKICNTTEKLIELVHSLLDVSRIHEGKLQLHKRNFSLTSLLQEVLEDIQPITDHPISIVGKTHIDVYADRDRIAQVLLNFITNAIKYSENTTEIVISSIEKPNEVIVSIRDFGFGIPQKDQSDIFKRFYQSKRNNNTFPGLGIGLYISSEIISEHGGTIWVESKEGEGSTFYFSLPISKKNTLY